MPCVFLDGQPLYLLCLVPALFFIGVFINGLMLQRLFRNKLSNARYRQFIILICGDSIVCLAASFGLFIKCDEYKLLQSLCHNVANFSFDLKMFFLNFLLVYWKSSIRV